MSKHFLIFTMPRCMSSWLSVLLTTDRSICFHDLAATATTLPETRHEYVGMACTGAAVEWRRWAELYPDAPIYVVMRDAVESRLALERVIDEVVSPARMAELEASLQEIRHEADNMRWSLAQDVPRRAAQIYKHCLPGLPLDMSRLAMLRTMNIQPHPPWMRSEIARLRKEGWPRA